MLAQFRPLPFYLLFYPFNIAFFYFHSLVLLKRLATNTLKDVWLIPLLTMIELVVYYILTCFIIFILIKFGYETLQSPYLERRFILSTIWRGTYFILYGTGYYFLIRYYQKKENTLTQTIENERLKNELLQTEQDFLRAQINPHLLFNTLSFIKYATRRKPDEADEAVIRLSGIMGFALDSTSKTIPLVNELEQVENIIGLNQLRYGHTLHVKYVTQIENASVTIIPIILLTLVENIFKHGNLSDESCPAEINVVSTNEYILLQTSNLPNQNSSVRSTHTGLSNISSRLKQFYKDTHEFSYGLEGNLFKVNVKINIPNN